MSRGVALVTGAAMNIGQSIAVGVRNLLDPNHYEGGTMFFNDAQVPRMVYAEFRMTIE